MFTNKMVIEALNKINEAYKDNDNIKPTVDVYINYITKEIEQSMFENCYEIKKVGGTDCRYIYLPKESFVKMYSKSTNLSGTYTEKIYFLEYDGRINIVFVQTVGGYTNRGQTVYFYSTYFMNGITNKHFEDVMNCPHIESYGKSLETRLVGTSSDWHKKIKELYGVKGFIEDKVEFEELTKEDLEKFIKSVFTTNYGKTAIFFYNDEYGNSHLSSKCVSHNDVKDSFYKYFKLKVLKIQEVSNEKFIEYFKTIFGDDIEIELNKRRNKISKFKLKGSLFDKIYKKIEWTIADRYYQEDDSLMELSTEITGDCTPFYYQNSSNCLSFNLVDDYLLSQATLINGLSEKRNDIIALSNLTNIEPENKEIVEKLIESETKGFYNLLERETTKYINQLNTFFDEKGYIVNIEPIYNKKIDFNPISKFDTRSYKLKVTFLAN